MGQNTGMSNILNHVMQNAIMVPLTSEYLRNEQTSHIQRVVDAERASSTKISPLAGGAGRDEIRHFRW